MWTNSMQQGSSWKADSHTCGKEIPHFVWKLRLITYLQDPATELYPEQIESDLHPHIPVL